MSRTITIIAVTFLFLGGFACVSEEALAAKAAPPDRSIVAEYNFDEGPDSKVVKDTSGHGNNGTNRGAEYVKGAGRLRVRAALRGPAGHGRLRQSSQPEPDR